MLPAVEKHYVDSNIPNIFCDASNIKHKHCFRTDLLKVPELMASSIDEIWPTILALHLATSFLEIVEVLVTKMGVSNCAGLIPLKLGVLPSILSIAMSCSLK